MTQSELDKALTQYMAPVEDDGFSDYLLRTLDPLDTPALTQTSQWRSWIIALTLGGVLGLFILRVLPHLFGQLTVPNLDLGYVPASAILVGMTVFALMVLDPDGLI